MAAFNTFLASLAIFSTLFLSLRKVLLSFPSLVSFLSFLSLVPSDEEERRFLLGRVGREGAESRKPTGVDEVDVEDASRLRFLAEFEGVSLGSVYMGANETIVRPRREVEKEKEATYGLPRPPFPSPSHCSRPPPAQQAKEMG